MGGSVAVLYENAAAWSDKWLCFSSLDDFEAPGAEVGAVRTSLVVVPTRHSLNIERFAVVFLHLMLVSFKSNFFDAYGEDV